MPYLWYILGAVVLLLFLWVLIFKILGLRVVSSNEVAVVEKWWSPKGSLRHSLIALHGEAGYLPELLRGGIHFRSALMYKIHKYPMITIPQGQIGYIFARDGEPLRPTQTLGRVVEEAKNFQDAGGFLEHGGQRGPQRGILREGVYAINLAEFIVVTASGLFSIGKDDAELKDITSMQDTIRQREGFTPVVIMSTTGASGRAVAGVSAEDEADERISGRRMAGNMSDMIGIVTVHDGDPIANGEIIAPDVENTHSNFQDPEKFLEAGGKRGKQLRVLTDGTYYINRLFATVEIVPKTTIPIGYVGVVTSFYGEKGQDMSGADFDHGQLVGEGCKGVRAEPLQPGKYALNTDACAVSFVPVTNVVLKWAANDSGGHSYDSGLAEVDIITKDAFEPRLPLSVVMHIDSKDAPMVILRFGDLNRLVNQSLDPLVSAYFKDVAQTKTLIQLIQERSAIREQALHDMREKFRSYNLALEEVLIGTPIANQNDHQIENILTQLRDRQIAEEQKVTFAKQKESADAEKALKESQAVALNQTTLTQSKIKIDIAQNEGQAEARRAEQEAQKIRTLAAANANKVSVEGQAEADREQAIGVAKATAIRKQVEAYGNPQYRMIQEVADRLSTAIQEAKVPTVPGTVVNLGQGDASRSILDFLMTAVGLRESGVPLKAPAAGALPVEKIPAEQAPAEQAPAEQAPAGK